MSRAPHCWVYLDTEAHRDPTARGERQSWRLGVTFHDHQGRERGTWRRSDAAVHYTPRALWEWVSERAVKQGRTIVVAHNLGYDLRVSDAFTILPALGWRLDRLRPDADQVHARWRRGTSTLSMIDSLGWWPAPLETIAADVGLKKLALPDDDDSEPAWARRCWRDVEILQAAWRQTLAWLWAEDLGTWQPSGAGQAWAGWRHRFMDVKVLVDDSDPERREAERTACWSGRAEAWRWGKVRGRVDEWDQSLAYLSIMRECLLPGRHLGRTFNPRLADALRAATGLRVLCTVRVRTPAPVLPARGAHGILWPVGDVETVVWDNELQLAVEAGAEVEIVRADYYEALPILATFGDWIAARIVDETVEVTPLVRRMLKHWSRAIVGRYGVRYAVWEEFGEALPAAVLLQALVDVDSGERSRLLTIGATTLKQSDLIDGENAVPAVMGYVMAECRVRLWRAMQAAGLDHVLYVDTDGLLVDPDGSAALAAARVPGLRLKGSWRGVEVLGPRQLVLGKELRASGVPKRAVRVSPRRWDAEVWPRLATSLASGEPAAVLVQQRTYTLQGTDHRRRHVAKGQTEPLEVGT